MNPSLHYPFYPFCAAERASCVRVFRRALSALSLLLHPTTYSSTVSISRLHSVAQDKKSIQRLNPRAKHVIGLLKAPSIELDLLAGLAS